MTESNEPNRLQPDSPAPPTGYIAIGLRQTDRGLRMVRLFTTDTLPEKFIQPS